MGLEPTTLGTTIQCSNRLSYIHHVNNLSGKPSRRKEGERWDLNPRPLEPQSNALTD